MQAVTPTLGVKELYFASRGHFQLLTQSDSDVVAAKLVAP